MEIIEQLRLDEGFRPYPYKCSRGVLTIGFGRNIDKDRGGSGISKSEGGVMLRNDLIKVERDIQAVFPDWGQFDQVRKNALLNMRFQLGGKGLRTFKRMIAAVNRGQWIIAAYEATQSRWAVQTPKRAIRVIMEIRDGVALS